MEMLTPMVIGQAIGAAKGSGNPRVFIPLHRGAAGFLNDEQFAKYYWPGLKAVIFALLEAGVTPCPFFEGDYTPRLKYLAELPPGVVAAHFDRTDRKKFKEMCGHNLCFWGDVPGSLMVTGQARRGQGLRQGADRGLRRHRRAHRRRRQLHHRRGQAGERHGAARGRGRVRGVLRRRAGGPAASRRSEDDDGRGAVKAPLPFVRSGLGRLPGYLPCTESTIALTFSNLAFGGRAQPIAMMKPSGPTSVSRRSQ